MFQVSSISYNSLLKHLYNFSQNTSYLLGEIWTNKSQVRNTNKFNVLDKNKAMKLDIVF